MLDARGRAWCFGDNINTDYIIPSRRKKDTIDPEELVSFMMEDIRPGFYSLLSGPRVLVAGENFGCGSAMEVAAQVVKSAGFSVVIAKSFARSFYRNAVNNGILVIEMDTSSITEGSEIAIHMDDEAITVTLEETGEKFSFPPFSGKLGQILSSGGIVEYMKKRINGE
ncbi:MAG: 3-isopropylmalate dehydratase small subunit [Spirochaetales bacterium]|nr:3-isopropylmalate dehydratase small subunit [Spirochaetales bacterium]